MSGNIIYNFEEILHLNLDENFEKDPDEKNLWVFFEPIIGKHIKIELSEARISLNISKSEFSDSKHWSDFVLLNRQTIIDQKLDNIKFWISENIIHHDEITDQGEITNITIQTKAFDIYNSDDLRNEFLNCLNSLNLLSANKPIELSYLEGNKKEIIIKKIERSKPLREKAVKIHGLNCKICGMNFKDVYGNLGAEFIHIHHLEMLSQTGARKVDPAKDLIPVCPNCHSMLHKKKPPLDPCKLREIYSKT